MARFPGLLAEALLFSVCSELSEAGLRRASDAPEAGCFGGIATGRLQELRRPAAAGRVLSL